MSKKIAVIGSGFAGLSAATHLAAKGYDVEIFEKNSTPGGRARQLNQDGFIFDMGPTWYWMPDVIESHFNKFDKSVSQYFQLKRLDPAYRIFFENEEVWDVPASIKELSALLESVEQGASKNLGKFLEGAKYKYEVGIQNLVYKPGRSMLEFLDINVLKGVFKLQIFQSMHSHVRKYFKDPRIIQLMEFPVLFLGATPKKTPALYSLMNYADLSLGTWYPEGGMYSLPKSMAELALEKGVKINYDTPVSGFEYSGSSVNAIKTGKSKVKVDGVVASADYNHVEEDLLNKSARNYSEDYWNSRSMSPSALIFYLGVNKKLEGLEHHNLFFDSSFSKHANEIYDNPKWPSNPLFYVSCTSKTDPTVAPKGHENLFVLIPIAAGLKNDDEVRRMEYLDIIIKRVEKLTKQQFRENIVYKKSYCLKDFQADYNAFKGNAYGLANTLGQTAILKPAMHNKKLRNLVYSGQLTVPGPGIPPSIISGEVAATEMQHILNK